MTVQRKAFPVELKALDDEKGRVEAIVSVFGNVDLGGDKVMPGAFTKSIEKWKASGVPVPVVFSHKWDDLWSHIGAVDTLEETEQGLKAIYTLDIDDNPAAKQAYKLMKRGSLKEHSFAYTVGKEKANGGANELHELDLIEVGPTLKGMNPDTELLAVKSALEASTAVKAQKLMDSDLRRELSDAARERFGGPNRYVYIEDREVDDDWAVFYIGSDEAESRWVRVSYARDGDTVSLGDDERDVEPVTQYEPKSLTHRFVPTGKAGRTLSKANEAKIKSAVEALTEVLSSLGDVESEKADEAEAVKPDEGEGDKASDPELLSLIRRIENAKE